MGVSEIKEFNFTLTQAESQKIEFIIDVVDYFLEYKEASIPELEYKLKILRKSAERTINRLKVLELIKIKEVQDRGRRNYCYTSKIKLKKYKKFLSEQYNRKFTGLDSNEEIKFMKKINSLWGKISNRILNEATKHHRFNSNILREKFRVKSPEFQKKITDIPWPDEITIRDIRFHHARKIKKDYGDGHICNTCMKEERVLNYFKTNYVDFQLYCSKGHILKIEQSPETFIESQRLDDTQKQKILDMYKSHRIM